MQKQRKKATSGEAQFKIIIVGQSAVGKSCLLARYVKNIFVPQYHVTLGAQFQTKTIQIDQNYRVKLQIWDTAGQETFRSIIKTFYRNSAAVMIVFNLTSLKTFQKMDIWLKQARQNAPVGAFYVLVGTHSDLVRQVSKEMISQFTKANNIALSFQTSALQNINIALAFQQVAKQIFVRYLAQNKRISDLTAGMKSNQALKPQQQTGQKKKCCGS